MSYDHTRFCLQCCQQEKDPCVLLPSFPLLSLIVKFEIKLILGVNLLELTNRNENFIFLKLILSMQDIFALKFSQSFIKYQSGFN